MYAVQVEPLTLEASSTNDLMVLSTLFTMSDGIGSAPVSAIVPAGASAADIDAALRDAAVAKAADFGLTLPRGNIVTVGLMT